MTETSEPSSSSSSPAGPPPGAVPPPSRAWLRTGVKAAVALLALAFVAWVVPLRDRCTAAGCEPGLLTTLRTANAPLIVALFALYLASTLAWAARWRALLGVAGVRVPLLGAWRITLEALAGGILLPGGIAGDALRVAFVRAYAPEADLAKIVASVFADRVVGLVTLAALATLAAVAMGAGDVGVFLHVVAAIPVASVLGWLVLRRPGLASARIFQTGILARVVRPMLEYAAAKDGPRALLRGVLLSSAVSVAQLLVIRGLVAALGAPPAREAWVYVGTTLGMMVGALPLAPGAWGTADAAYVFFLGQAGISASVALSTCLLYRVYWYASAVVGAVLALRPKKTP